MIPPFNVPSIFLDPINWLIAISAFIAITLIIREIVCWYWKINRIVELLEDIRQTTKNGLSDTPVELKNESKDRVV